ncbi:inactive tyrosine-protein kinase PRAG1 isoform X2 [Pleurodeles waltl]
MERNITLGCANLLSGQDDKTRFLCKEKLTTTQGVFTQETVLSRNTRSNGATESTGYLCIQTREGGVFSVSGTNGCSASFQGDGGDYCQITNCANKSPDTEDAASLEGRKALHDGRSPATGLSTQEALGARKPNKEERTLVNSHWADHALHNCKPNPASVDSKKPSVPKLPSLSDISLCTSSLGSPLASPQEGNYYNLSGELELHQNPGKETSMNPSRNPLDKRVTEPVLVQQFEASKNEPIYAESTKRKKGILVNGALTLAKSDGPSKMSHTKQNSDTSAERTAAWSNQAPQESTTQVTAKITVMAAHTEEDNRTIYLSSPDSAVSVQWSCVSPSSSLEFGTSPPLFEWGEANKGSKEVGQSDNGQTCRTLAVAKNAVEGNPSIPPKISRNGQLDSEQSHTMLDSLPACSGTKPNTAITPSSRNNHGFSPCGNSSSRSPQKTFPEQDRTALQLATERRHKYYNATWSKQGRIEEEEEEEGLSQQTKAQGGELRTTGHFKSSSKLHTDISPPADPATRMGMSKSASCPHEFLKDRSKAEDASSPPPCPPKRHAVKTSKGSCELERQGAGSAGSLTPPSLAFGGSSFITSSTDSLSSDTRTCSDGGQSIEGIHSPALPQCTKRPLLPLPLSMSASEDSPFVGSLQPPPLPLKKTVGRTASAPDNSFWGQASPGLRLLSPTSPRLNMSQSESNVCRQEAGQFSCPSSPGDSQPLFSSSESLEKVCRWHGHRSEARGWQCLQSRSAHSLSSSQLNMSSHGSSGSTLQLHNLLSNIDNKEGMYAKLGGLYAESLRRLVAKCEDCFMRDQKTELCFNENSWSLFKLTCNKPCCDSGDAIYYCATCAKDPQNTYAVKICKPESSKSPTYCSLSLPVHFNIQQDCGHFLATVPSSMSQSTKASSGSSATSSAPQTQGSSEQECVVVITREVPHQTAADFVKDSVSSHSSQPEVYERQVCFLLLQLCNGLEHLKEHGIIHRDLCLENLLLVHCPSVMGKTTTDDKRLPRLIISNFSKAKQRSGASNSKLKRDQARLAPEIVSASQYKKFDEFQTGILIYELLHQPNPFEDRAHLREQEYSQEDLPPVPILSLYSKGLQQLAHLLLEADPIKRIRITEAKRVLQCLLWGPRKDLADQPLSNEEALHGALQNWIDMKRALLMMKFAERAIDLERGIELEDWLCCQYLASTDPCFLFHTLRLLTLL